MSTTIDISIEHIGIIFVTRGIHQRSGKDVFIIGDCLFKEDGVISTGFLQDQVVEKDRSNRYQIKEVVEELYIERKPIETERERRERINREKMRLFYELQREGKTVLDPF